MRPVLCFLALLSIGCTTVKDPVSGKRILFTTANADHLKLTSPNVTLEATNLRHESASAIIGAGGAAATALGLGAGLGVGGL